MGYGKKDRYCILEDIVIFAEGAKAFLIGLHDAQDQVDPPQKTWMPKSQCTKEYEDKEHPGGAWYYQQTDTFLGKDFRGNERAFPIVKITIKEWILQKKYEVAINGTTEEDRSQGCEPGLFDDSCIDTVELEAL